MVIASPVTTRIAIRNNKYFIQPTRSIVVDYPDMSHRGDHLHADRNYAKHTQDNQRKADIRNRKENFTACYRLYVFHSSGYSFHLLPFFVFRS
ncbi:hypothetical protein KL86DES1_22255 [uncultured Desulfovibrio sp.]|uniref:Uncharacterized protein n=1 Tax=uncultured Desulfovibrio sp. TaxID=167968 RepID=A0A212LBL1_9BACT|nr:hypothetical protein KL86DES1_22255 [uncultured Desulfovibrio sp.]VZH35149.1 conserved protein of unknown function [Desulfovibrio sp. 86]